MLTHLKRSKLLKQVKRMSRSLKIQMMYSNRGLIYSIKIGQNLDLKPNKKIKRLVKNLLMEKNQEQITKTKMRVKRMIVNSSCPKLIYKTQICIAYMEIKIMRKSRTKKTQIAKNKIKMNFFGMIVYLQKQNSNPKSSPQQISKMNLIL